MLRALRGPDHFSGLRENGIGVFRDSAAVGAFHLDNSGIGDHLVKALKPGVVGVAQAVEKCLIAVALKVDKIVGIFPDAPGNVQMLCYCGGIGGVV